MDWNTLEQACRHCTNCQLAEGRTNVVIGDGNPNADIMLIGEGPGQQEDLQGIPFVGAAGQLLDKMLAAIDFSREDVYIANIVKCRPPGNRDPREEEQAACIAYLRHQLVLVKPRIIVCLGRIAALSIIDRNFKITKERGLWIQRKGYWIMATYHPAALLRDETKKRPAWEDFKAVRKKYDQWKAGEDEVFP